jgi:hypothetical protein
MLLENYIVFEENNIIKIKYTMKSNNINTEWRMMPWEVKIMNLDDLITKRKFKRYKKLILK